MHVSRTLTYAADVATVYAMHIDPAFQEHKCVESGAPKHSVQVGEPDAHGAVTVRTSRTVPTQDLPSFVRSAVGSSLTIDESYEWTALSDKGARAPMTLRISGAPVTLTGEIVLEPTGEDTSQLRVEGELKAAVPLMGGKIEKAVAPVIDEQLQAEEKIAAEWLAR